MHKGKAKRRAPKCGIILARAHHHRLFLSIHTQQEVQGRNLRQKDPVLTHTPTHTHTCCTHPTTQAVDTFCLPAGTFGNRNGRIRLEELANIVRETHGAIEKFERALVKKALSKVSVQVALRCVCVRVCVRAARARVCVCVCLFVCLCAGALSFTFPCETRGDSSFHLSPCRGENLTLKGI